MIDCVTAWLKSKILIVAEIGATHLSENIATGLVADVVLFVD